MSSYFDMGGYAGYVWPAWGIAVVVLGALIVASIRSMRARERELARLEEEAPRRRRRRSMAAAEIDAGIQDSGTDPS